jgi:hypothetical protein
MAGFGSNPGQFNRPAGLTVDKSGNVYVADAGNDRVQILTFPTAPVITNQPASQYVTVGANATFAVGVGSFSPVAYQWQFGGNNVAGATLSALTLNNVNLGNAGNYQVIVTNLYRAITSAPAALTVVGVPPQITTQPQSQTLRSGAQAAFAVSASGTPPFSYQWLFNATKVLTGSTTATLILPYVTSASAGTYTVVVSNSFGIALSSPAVLSVLPPVTAQLGPPLVISMSNRAVVIRWSSAASGYLLETTTELPDVGLWQPWAISGDDGTWKSAIISSNSLLSRQFFRLRLQ